jgi:alanyl-tRNA synthetase
MNALMREACEMLDGRGGGRTDMAQGGGRNTERLAEAIEQAAHKLAID